jgi:hypothetical protein
MSPRGGSTPRQTDWLTVSCNVTLTLTLTVSSLVLEDISARELQLKGARQRGQEPLVTEAEDATPLEAATKRRTEDRDWEH